MRVLLTGADGFLGRATLRALLAKGHAVRALRRSAPAAAGAAGDAVESWIGDLRTTDLDAALAGVDAVVHLAVSFHGDFVDQVQATVAPTEALLAAMARAGTQELVLVSSLSVYDWSAPGRTLDESSPLERRLLRRDAYALAKTWQERLCRRHARAHGLRLAILRPGFVWARERASLDAVGVRIGRVLLVIGPLRRLPLVHVESCADAVALCVGSSAAAGEALNAVDSGAVRAWHHAGELIRGGATRARWLVPLPYHLGLAVAVAASALARLVLGPDARLPGLLVPERYRARFRPLHFPNAKARRVLGWKPAATDEILARELRGA